MWSKRNRLTVCVQIFEDLYWQDIPEKESHIAFSQEELEDLVPGEKIDVIDYKLVQKALKLWRKNGEEYYQKVFETYMDNWSKTLLSVRAVLYGWVLESEMTGVPKEELVGKYIKLTQDLVAGGNTGLVHALLSKVSGTYHESTPAESEKSEEPQASTDHE
jgi:transcription termination factor NusB